MLSVTFPPQKRATGKDAPARLKKAPSLAAVFQIPGNTPYRKKEVQPEKGLPVRFHGAATGKKRL